MSPEARTAARAAAPEPPHVNFIWRYLTGSSGWRTVMSPNFIR